LVLGVNIPSCLWFNKCKYCGKELNEAERQRLVDTCYICSIKDHKQTKWGDFIEKDPLEKSSKYIKATKKYFKEIENINEPLKSEETENINFSKVVANPKDLGSAWLNSNNIRFRFNEDIEIKANEYFVLRPNERKLKDYHPDFIMYRVKPKPVFPEEPAL